MVWNIVVMASDAGDPYPDPNAHGHGRTVTDTSVLVTPMFAVFVDICRQPQTTRREGAPRRRVGRTAQSSTVDYKTDYILVRQPWTMLDVSVTALLNSSHTWTILDGPEHRVLVF